MRKRECWRERRGERKWMLRRRVGRVKDKEWWSDRRWMLGNKGGDRDKREQSEVRWMLERE